MKLEPIIEAPYMVTGLWKNYAVHLFEGKVTLGDMDRIEADAIAWHSKLKDKLVEMVVIYPSDSKMTQDERVRMAGIIRRWEKTRLASATVIVADSLVGSLHRSVLTGLQMLAPSPHPTKVFGTIDDATRWLCPYVVKACGTAVRPEALGAAVDELAVRFLARTERAPR